MNKSDDFLKAESLDEEKKFFCLLSKATKRGRVPYTI